MEWIFEIPKCKITYNTLLVDIKDFIYCTCIYDTCRGTNVAYSLIFNYCACNFSASANFCITETS